MNKTLFYLLFFALLLAPAGTASAALPDSMSNQDIFRASDGNPPAGTGSDYDGAGTFTVTGAGRDIWDDRDNFQYCYLPASGDIELSARVVSITGGSHEWCKAGVMIRETLDDNSAHRFMALSNNQTTAHAAAFQGRNSTGAGSNSNHDNEQPSPYNVGDPLWVRLVRSGDVFTGYFSTNGVDWTEQTPSQTVAMGADVYVGLAVTSHDNSFTVTGTFDNLLLNGLFPGTCGANNPDPPSGSFVPPEIFETNVYMLLDYNPGSCTEGYWSEGFFSTDKALVDAMDPSVSLGTVPPWPLIDENAWVVGYDDPGIPEHARAPLVPGTEYFWSVASWDGTEWWPSQTWSFTPIPKSAWDPDPADGETLIPTDVTATWQLGDVDPTAGTLKYHVYIGTDETAVGAVATGDTVSPLYAGNVPTETIELTGLDPETVQFWRVDTGLTLTRPPFSTTWEKGDVWSFTTGPAGIGGILVEYWDDIGGGTVADLTGDVNYPDNPARTDILDIFETPTNQRDNFGGRVRGWLYVETAGDYTFWCCSDDNSDLYVSTDMSPANAGLVSQTTGWAPARAFGDPDVIPGTLNLTAGMHYVEALYKEGGGGDNLAVAWMGPDSGDQQEVIPGKHLIPYSPVIADNPNPAHLSIDAPLNVTLTWTGGEDMATELPYATQRVYVGDSAAAVAAATTSSPEYKGTVSTDSYGPLSLSYYQQVYWRVDGVTGAGEVQFPGAVWTFRATYDPGQVLDTNLRLWLKFEDNALDSSGYGRHGTEMGGPTYVAGQDGQAIDLDGIDDYVDGPYGAGISGADPRTIAGWAKARTTAITNWTNIFGFSSPQTTGQHFDIEVVGDTDSTTQGWFGLHLNGDEYDILPPDIEWHHFAATFDGASVALYGDGVQVGIVVPSVVINTNDAIRVGNRIDNAAYFPGSVDDVRVYDVVKTEAQIAEIMRINLAWAWNPNPTHGATGVPRDQTLSWSHGDGMSNSTVFFGADDPSNMVQVAGPQSATVYDPPGDLDLGTDYYWQISENSMAPGRIWRFTTSGYRNVDDMETYTPWTTAGNNIFETWRDGEGNCLPGNGNDTGSSLSTNEDPAFILNGLKSMKYDFDNDGMVYSPCDLIQKPRLYLYSEVEAQVGTLPSNIGTDWTAGGVKALTINFLGQAGNATTEPLWAQLQDSSKTYGTKVFYGDYEGEDIADMNDPSWHEWNIDLADFNVDLTNVVSIVIGIGNEGATSQGGSGTIYVDDIRLYVPKCVPARASSPADFDKNCRVDYGDVAALFDAWLLQKLPETVWNSGVWTSVDIGDSNVPGSFSDLGGGAYTVTGGGADVWGADDGFHYVYKPLSGDAQMTIRVTDIGGPSTNAWRKAGIMIRETLDTNSNHAFVCVTAGGGGGSSFQWRSDADGDNNNQDGPAGVTTPQCIRLVRVGDVFSAFRYVNGEWVPHGNSVVVPMAQDVLIGLAVTSHEVTMMSTVQLDRVCSDDFISIDLVEDDVINFEDYADLLNVWMEEVLWPNW